MHEEELGRLSRHGCSFRPRSWPVAVRRSRGEGASKQAIARNGARGTIKHHSRGSEAKVG